MTAVTDSGDYALLNGQAFRSAVPPLALIVDDSAMDRLYASRLVDNTMGWRVATAANGLEALVLMEREEPSIVLTDMCMPEMDGLALVQAIRLKHPLIPVVLMTAHGSEEIAIQALQAGAASYIPKKRLADYLVETIDQVHTSSQASRQQQHLLDCLAKAESHFVLESNPALVTPLVGYLQEQLSRFKLVDPNVHMRIGIALEESLLNGIYHGNLEVGSELRQSGDEGFQQLARDRAKLFPYRERQLRVHASLSRTKAVYVIADEGPGFEPARLPDPTDPANLGNASGRGLLLIRTFMDEVFFNEKGNEITLIKHGHPLREKKR